MTELQDGPNFNEFWDEKEQHSNPYFSLAPVDYAFRLRTSAAPLTRPTDTEVKVLSTNFLLKVRL